LAERARLIRLMPVLGDAFDGGRGMGLFWVLLLA
jgi:hypothetical protein